MAPSKGILPLHLVQPGPAIRPAVLLNPFL